MRNRPLLVAWGVVIAALLALGVWLSTGSSKPPAPAVEIALPAPAAEPAPPPPPPPEPAAEPAPPAAPASAAPAALAGPDPALLASGPDGPLPVVGPDGRKPWQAYARPFDAPADRPRVAILIGPLGMNEARTAAAIERLPADVALAFSPYGEEVGEWVRRARSDGHETLLGVPMEPLAYPQHDPGPKALFTGLDPKQNMARLEWAMSQATGYVGLTPYMGERFLAAPDQLRPILAAVRDRGLLLADSRATVRSAVGRLAAELRLPRAGADRILDAEPSRDAVAEQLAELERIARERGAAFGIGHPYPVTVEQVADWAAGLAGKGLALAPVSAVVERQADR